MTSASDTGPLNYLIQIGAVSALGDLFDAVVIPRAVCNELTSEASPRVVQEWVAAMPAWCRVVDLDAKLVAAGRHAGEREAISLLTHFPIRILLADDRGARAAAKQLKDVEVLGTIAILVQASLTNKSNSLERFDQWICRLRETNFYFSFSLEAAIEHIRKQVLTS